jgi:signal transduction histidine kinase/DNA-binding response OmpR family regulator
MRRIKAMNQSTIVVVDDDPALLKAMVRVLTQAGHLALEASSGLEGIALAEKARPDIMIVDVVLPDMSGIEVHRALRSHDTLHDTPVILISSIRTSSEEKAEGLLEGVCEYIARPISNREFLARVNAVIAEKKAKERLKKALDDALSAADAASAGIIRAEEDLQKAIVTGKDVQRQKPDLEEELLVILQGAPMGIFLADQDARLYMAGNALGRLFGRPPQAMIGRRCGHAFGCANAKVHAAGCGLGIPCRDCVLRKTIVEAYNTEKPLLQVDAEMNLGEGGRERRLHLCLSASPVIVSGQKRVLVFMEDVSNRRASERREKELESQLYQAQKMESVGRLAGGVAHDFNNLLTVILGYGDILLGDLQENHPYYSMLRAIHDSAMRARTLTRQLLAFSRKQVLEMTTVDVNSVVSGFEKLLRRVIGEDITLELMLAQSPLTIRADPAQIEQVLMNLAVNARDAMPRGGKLTMETATVCLDEAYAAAKPGVIPGKYAVIRISDTGCGMDKATLARVFEPFFTTKPKDKGTGLGLATSYGIVKQHGGNIWAYSEPGLGTTFKIYLPLIKEGNIEERASPLPNLTPSGNAAVLVVEDDPSVRELAASILRRGGYDVMEAEGISDALNLLDRRGGNIDLLITDVIMPEMDGPDVYLRLSQRYPEMAVLYMSGYTDDVLDRRGVRKDGLHFIQKPFTAGLLLEHVAAVLKRKLSSAQDRDR